MERAKDVERLLKHVHLAARRALLALGEGTLPAREIRRRDSRLEELWLDLDGPVGLVHLLGLGARGDEAFRFGGVLLDCVAHLREIYGLFHDIESDPAVSRFVEEVLRPAYQDLRRRTEEEHLLGGTPALLQGGGLAPADPETSRSDRLLV